MKATTNNNRRRAWLLLGAASLALLVAVCAGITPAALGGLPVLPGCVGLSVSLVNIFIP